MDPDLLVFGKHFPSNIRAFPHHSGRINASELLAYDKRQFIHPPPSLPTTSPHPASAAGGQPCDTTSLQAGGGASTAPTSTASSPSPPDGPGGRSPAWPSRGNSETPSTFPTTTVQPWTSPPSDHTSTHQTPDPTASSLGRNHTPASEEADQAEGGVGALDPGWSGSAHTLLLLVVMVVVVVITVLLSCCCSVLLLASWQDQRKRRMVCYRAPLREKRGSTRLKKYVLVRENN